MALRHDPPISAVPAEFTSAEAIVAAVIANSYSALARAAVAPSADDEDAVRVPPNRVLRAQLMADLWITAAREAQTRANQQRLKTPDGAPADASG